MAIRKSTTRMKSLWASSTCPSDQRLTSIDTDTFDQTDVVGSCEFETDLDVCMSRGKSNQRSHARSSERSSERSNERSNQRSNEESQDSFQDACADGGQYEGVSEIQIGDSCANSDMDSRGSSQSDPCESPEISENEQIEQTKVCVEGRDQKYAQQSRRLRRLGHRDRHRDRHRDIATAIRKALTRCDEGWHQSVCLDVLDTSQSQTSQFPTFQFPTSQFPTFQCPTSQFLACLR